MQTGLAGSTVLEKNVVLAGQVGSSGHLTVHEGAVVHAMSAVLPALLGWAERAKENNGGISGERLLRAVIAGIDVAVTLGLCSRAPMRFFRPSTAGAFGWLLNELMR